MPFNSYIFMFLFLPVTLIGYYGLQHIKQNKLAQGYLIAMSMWFYGYQSIACLCLLLVSVLVNYGLVHAMWRITSNRIKNALLGVGLAWNIGSLFLFKYYNFFIENVNAVTGEELPLLQLIMPLGISFYTFAQLSYLIDSYRQECEEYRFLEYAEYALFFPKMVQGPIMYHQEMIPKMREESARQLDYENMSKGFYAFALGLAKKVLIADTLAKIVTRGYYDPDELNTTSAILVMICYSLQIYFDFSGYCDMAIGIGYMFNIEIPMNFNSPYKADSIDEFWDRWHMTLTRFFTKYVYFPLGGSRRGVIRTYINIMVVFFVSGLWHGANWTFILWGAMHGVAKVIHRLGRKVVPFVPKWIRTGVTFIFVTAAWSIFRASSMGQVRELWYQVRYGGFGTIQTFLTDIFNGLVEVKILYRMGFGGIIDAYPACMLITFVMGVLAACFFMRNTQEKVQTLRLTNWKIIVIVVLMVWSIVSLSEVTQFIYANF